MKEKLMIKCEYMKAALLEAQKAYEAGEVPVGAVIVQGDRVIAAEHNTVEENKDASEHAELLALRQAAKVLDKRRLNDCVMYVTMEPCPMCMGAAFNYRLGAICFGAFDSVAGSAVSKIELGELLNLQMPVIGGVMEDECAKLLTDFFKNKR